MSEAQERIAALRHFFHSIEAIGPADEVWLNWCIKLAGEDGDEHIPKAWVQEYRSRNDE